MVARREDEQPTVYCSSCGSSRPGSRGFCVSCGSSPQGGAGRRREHRPRPLWERWLLGVILLLLAYFFVARFIPVREGTAPGPAGATRQVHASPENRREDLRVELGDTAQLGGLTVAVSNATVHPGPPQQICFHVEQTNVSGRTWRTGWADWSLRFRSAIVAAASSSPRTEAVESFVLSPGERVTGTVCFEDRAERGLQELQWRPASLGSSATWLIPR